MMVTGVHADALASPRGAGELGTTGTGTTGTGTLGEPVEPACPGTGTTGVDVPATGTTGVEVPATGTTGVDGEGVAMTGGPTKAVEDAPASMGLGVEVATGTGTTVGVLLAGQFLTVGAQLVRISPTVL